MKNEKMIYIIVGIVSVLGCSYLFFSSKGGSIAGSGGSTVTYGQVDQLRKETKIRKELQSKKMAVDNYKSAPSLSNQYRQVEDEQAKKSGIQFESEKHSVANDADIEPDREPVNMLENQINKRLVNDQKAAQLSAAQKEAFIENYKKQALAKGYLVELNDQLVVTKVQKVATKKGPASIEQEEVEMQEFEEDEGGD